MSLFSSVVLLHVTKSMETLIVCAYIHKSIYYTIFNKVRIFTCTHLFKGVLLKRINCAVL
jgi:hypothetical protein